MKVLSSIDNRISDASLAALSDGYQAAAKRVAALESAMLSCNEFATVAGNTEGHTSEERFGARMVGVYIRRELDKLGL